MTIKASASQMVIELVDLAEPSRRFKSAGVELTLVVVAAASTGR